MSSEDNSSNRIVVLIHLHTCIHCGHTRSREEVRDREVNSGILQCPACGMDGPLNIEIRTMQAA